MSTSFANDPAHWQERAKQMRILANDANDETAKRLMLDTADDYELLARRAEERATGSFKSSKWSQAPDDPAGARNGFGEPRESGAKIDAIATSAGGRACRGLLWDRQPCSGWRMSWARSIGHEHNDIVGFKTAQRRR